MKLGKSYQCGCCLALILSSMWRLQGSQLQSETRQETRLAEARTIAPAFCCQLSAAFPLLCPCPGLKPPFRPGMPSLLPGAVPRPPDAWPVLYVACPLPGLALTTRTRPGGKSHTMIALVYAVHSVIDFSRAGEPKRTTAGPPPARPGPALILLRALRCGSSYSAVRHGGETGSGPCGPFASSAASPHFGVWSAKRRAGW